MDFKANWRIWVLVVAIIISLTLIGTKGLTYGIDFIGGTELKLELAQGGDQVIQDITLILKNRLNGLGLKSVQVLPEADKEHITIKVSATEPEDIAKIKNILNQQAIFEQYVDGDLCAEGEEIQLDITRTGGAAIVTGSSWQVHVKTVGEAPKRCGEAMKDRAGHMTDIFLDRPKDSVVLLSDSECSQLSASDFSNNADDAGYTMLEFIETRANLDVVCYADSSEVKQQGIADELGLIFENETVNSTNSSEDDLEAADELLSLLDNGKTSIISTVNLSKLPESISSILSERNISVRVIEKTEDIAWHQYGGESWIAELTGLKSTLSIQEGLTYGSPIYASVFTGTADTEKEADTIVESYKIWLTSGNLPVKINIVLEKPNLPELGQRFLEYSLYIALIAVLMVAIVISIRYREPKISAFILLIGLSEVLIILGFASLVSWELDLAAVAGIIAAVGTGVDHQIVITDETLRGERRKKDQKVWDVKDAVGRAFFIIFTAAATTIVAMLPLFSIIDLKGFAFTTIIGVLIGIMITRPAYGKIIELIT